MFLKHHLKTRWSVLKERQIVDCIFKGISNQEIANALNISLNTVKMHLQIFTEKTTLKGEFN
ncbi:LuxR C-terminal-related transcriptional regulator [Shewanella indica]|uniref:LuxR C-terminal-related transcriptional regulator n=1 Tax=Shewanella indica TaxID=768528 RepID=UPI003D35FD5E